MNDAFKLSARTAGMLLVFTLVVTTLMALVYDATKPKIAESAQAAKLALIAQILPPDSFDNALLEDTLELPPTPELGLTTPSTVYRARKAGQPVALVIEAIAPDGYSGQIRLAIALRVDGTVAGVRVTDHKETPGLGDYIDPLKDKNKTQPWIAQFSDPQHAVTPPDTWRLKKDGGQFDYMTGATISARAVTQAVGRAVRFAQDQRTRLFAPAPTPR